MIPTNEHVHDYRSALKLSTGKLMEELGFAHGLQRMKEMIRLT